MSLLKKMFPLIGIILFFYLIVRIGIKTILSKIVNANIWYMLLGISFIVPIILMQSLKWHLILKKQRIKIKFSDSIKLQVISLFYGTVTPARIGSFVKILYLEKKVKNFGKAASSVIIDRFFDLITVAILACIGSIILASNLPKILVPLIIFSGFIALAILLIVSKKHGRRIVEFFYEKLTPKTIKQKTRKTFKEFYKSMPKKRDLIIPLILNILNWILIYTQLYIISKAMGMNISYAIAIFIFPISTIISQIPISIGGIGVREASLITLLALFDVPADLVMSTSIVSLIITNILPSIVGMILSAKGYDLRKKK
ncbi:MAG: lysylphosphatidylglycerol synthase transmembrane domain-containing protein [archaeon]